MSGQPATAEPCAPVGQGFMALFAPIQVLLALQMETIAPDGKEVALGCVTGIGALVSRLANPLSARACTRTSPGPGSGAF